MRDLLTVASIVLLLVGCASRDKRLEGRWKSNKVLTADTIDNWKPRSGPLTAHNRSAFAALFGKLIVSYHRGTATSEMPSSHGQSPYRSTSRYRIVASDDDSLAYVSTNPLTERPEISHVYFEGPNRYWIYLHRTSMKEYFDRISP